MPLPDVIALTLIQVALLVAVQAQKVAAVTMTVPVIPADVTVADAGEIDGAQTAAAWLTVKVLPPIVSVAVRDVVPVFAETL